MSTYQASCHLDRIQQAHIIQGMASLHQATTRFVRVLTDMKFTLNEIVWGSGTRERESEHTWQLAALFVQSDMLFFAFIRSLLQSFL